MTESDEPLAALAKAGDALAFETLVRRHKTAMYGLCRRYVGDPDDAYDVLQDTFAAAWTGLRRYDTARPFGAWLRTIALNKCRDFSRRRSVRRLFLMNFAQDVEDRVLPDASREACDPQNRRLEQMDQEIAALPAAYKEALLLTALGGLSHQEAAAELGVTVKAIEMRVYRAKRQLAARLGEADGFADP